MREKMNKKLMKNNNPLNKKKHLKILKKAIIIVTQMKIKVN